MKIIINTPYISSPAGVSSHYRGLKPYFSKDVIYNQFFTANFLRRVLKVDGFALKILRALLMPFDILKFSFRIITHRDVHILLNPSFGITAIKRDLMFAKIAKFLGARYSFFIHGWTKSYYEQVRDGSIRLNDIFYKASSYFVLASEFETQLRAIGVTAPIYLTTTKVPDTMIENFNVTNKSEVRRILYLARIEKDKGIFETIEVFKILHRQYPDLQFEVVGSGAAFDAARQSAAELGDSIRFYGALYGDDVVKMFEKADIYILLSYHEGMPTSVLEAMAFGLPVITRPVGGLVDFFENGKMGYMEESLSPNVFARKCEHLIENIDELNKISLYNAQYAREHFMASRVAKQIENTIKTTIANETVKN